MLFRMRSQGVIERSQGVLNCIVSDSLQVLGEVKTETE